MKVIKEYDLHRAIQRALIIVSTSYCRLFKCSRNGVTLTESNAMSPASSICGFYFWHPEATYFNVGQIDSDQLKDYAERSKIHREVASQNLREVTTINAETSKE